MNQIPLPNFPYTRTYRFAMIHIAKLSYLADILHKDQSEIIRESLDEYFERHVDIETAPIWLAIEDEQK